MTVKVLITGHTGFIGRNMSAWMTNQGWSVEGWEWDPYERPDVRNFDWVIHLGAIADMTCTDVDSIMTQNLEFSQWLFNQCQRHQVNLQYASSSSVYGAARNFEEGSPCVPQTPYAWSKYLFDRWAFQQPQHRAFVQGFRYFNVYGKWQHLRGNRANAISKWRDQARTQGVIEIWKNADQIYRDWTWVGDICQLHVDFINSVKGSGIWNAGSGLSHSFKDIAEYIADQEAVEIKSIEMPLEEQTRFRPKVCADLKLLKQTIGRKKWLNVYEWLDLES